MINKLVDMKYKDDVPINTIKKIRNILSDLGILTREVSWKNSADSFFSVRVEIEGTNIGTNGKGTTAEYALASAYGEFMERLQNQTFFRLGMDIDFKSLKYKDFMYSPDEKYISIQDFIDSKNEWGDIQKKIIKDNIDINLLLKKWIGISYENTPKDFVTIPYFNIETKNISYIPIKMVSKMYMSNGMCAGNTQEEALIQGLSEIFERYVNKKLVQDKITPPTVPKKYLSEFPLLENMINNIEKSGNFKVIIKDCSLGRGYPVVGVILIDKNKQTYFIKFGSHPDFKIALERTLTELLQGQDINNMIGMKEFFYDVQIEDNNANLINILSNGSGYYPSEFFGSHFSYQFKGLSEVKSVDNKEILKYMIGVFKREGYNVFIRDVSFLGFPSYHIIVPGFSEIENIDDLKTINEYSNYNRIKRYIRNLKNLYDDEIEELIYNMINMIYNPNISITQLLDINNNGILPWYYSNINLFISILYYKLGKFDKSYDFFNNYLENLNLSYYDSNTISYYKCVRDYIAMRKKNMKEERIIEDLCIIYPNNLVEDVIRNFENNREIFKRYGILSCWDCKNCVFSNKCFYKNLERVYRIVKDKYSFTQIQQLKINIPYS